MKQICTFKESTKKLIEKDEILLTKVANLVGTTKQGVKTMLRSDSQTLFHNSVLEAISEALDIEIKYLKKCKR